MRLMAIAFGAVVGSQLLGAPALPLPFNDVRQSSSLRQHGVAPDSLAAIRAAVLIRAALDRSAVNATRAITLWRYYSCMSVRYDECADNLTDTVESSYRTSLRKLLGRCPQASHAPRLLVQVSRERVSGDSTAMLIGISDDSPGDNTPGDQWIFLARVKITPLPSQPPNFTLREIYHGTYSPGVVQSGVLSDDTCVR